MHFARGWRSIPSGKPGGRKSVIRHFALRAVSGVDKDQQVAGKFQDIRQTDILSTCLIDVDITLGIYMTTASSSNVLVQSTMPFLAGVAAVIALVNIGGAFGGASFLSAVMFEAGLCALACALGCVFAPWHPFRAAVLGLVGVLAAVVIDIVIHPTIDGGYERNLYPLEIAFHLVIAVPSFLLVALAWRAGFSLTHRGAKDAQPGG
ncbi:MAG: hypothetical protein JNM82_11065 [Rhodocyclaceae bacterium]|nr:hypothetical protein [Rhodocyclaceae bacterium]